MRIIWLIFLAFVLAACQVAPAVAPVTQDELIPTSTSVLTESLGTPTTEVQLPAWELRIHPVEVYVGDVLSFEVIDLDLLSTDAQSVEVSLPGAGETPLGSAKFEGYGIGNRRQATLTWVWDTEGLEAGDYDLVFRVLPTGTVFTQTITLQPQTDLPPLEAAAQWKEARTQCCIVHYIGNTEAERDLSEILVLIEEQATQASQRLRTNLDEPISVTLMPRLLGHGGFADQAIHVSYLDRNAAGDQSMMVIHHELVHTLDHRLGGDFTPAILVEGLAVYLTGGHFKPEPLLPRAAALLPMYGNPPIAGLDRYIPLGELADAFYTAQHEIGYLQAGALVGYLVERWGWEAFNAFYRDIHRVEGAGDAAAIDEALQRHFNLDLSAIESDFVAELKTQPADDFWREDVRLTVLHYNTLRRYQQLLDPAGYFLTAWLVDEQQMRERGIIADYMRRPEAPLNVLLELLLAASVQALLDGDLAETQNLLERTNRVLDAHENGNNYPAAVDGLAFTVYEQIGWLERYGLSPQTLSVEGDWLVFAVRAGSAAVKPLRMPLRW
jgi:hypothetical protein